MFYEIHVLLLLKKISLLKSKNKISLFTILLNRIKMPQFNFKKKKKKHFVSSCNLRLTNSFKNETIKSKASFKSLRKT